MYREADTRHTHGPNPEDGANGIINRQVSTERRLSEIENRWRACDDAKYAHIRARAREDGCIALQSTVSTVLEALKEHRKKMTLFLRYQSQNDDFWL